MSRVACIAAIALFIFAPSTASARTTVKRCCMWDPHKVLTCLMYCPGGSVANAGSSQTRALNSKAKGNTGAGVTTSGTKAK